MARPFASTATVIDPPRLSVNVIVPGGMPIPGVMELTVAVYVTDWPTSAGFTDDVNAVIVIAGVTVWFRALEVPFR